MNTDAHHSPTAESRTPRRAERDNRAVTACAAERCTDPTGINIRQEQLIRLGDVPQHLPLTARGKRINKSSPFRWAQRGIRGCRLEFIQAGGVRYTSAEALQRFFDRLTAVPPVTVDHRREREIERAEQEVRRALAKTAGTKHRATMSGDNQRSLT